MLHETQIPPLPKSRDPFRVPEGYFDNFTAEVMKKIKAGIPASRPESLRFPRIEKAYRRIQPFLNTAAVLVFAVLLSHFVYVAIINAGAASIQETPVSDNMSDMEMAGAYDYFVSQYGEYYDIEE